MLTLEDGTDRLSRKVGKELPTYQYSKGGSLKSSKAFFTVYRAPNDPILVAASSKAWVCGRSPAGIPGSNPAGGHGCLSVVSVVCCQVEVSALG